MTVLSMMASVIIGRPRAHRSGPEPSAATARTQACGERGHEQATDADRRSRTPTPFAPMPRSSATTTWTTSSKPKRNIVADETDEAR